MNCFEMWIFKGLMLFNWEIWLILKCNPHLNVFYIHICATNRPKLCWDKSWDIDIKIKGKIVGRWYQEFHGVPLEINCVYWKLIRESYNCYWELSKNNFQVFSKLSMNSIRSLCVDYVLTARVVRWRPLQVVGKPCLFLRMQIGRAGTKRCDPLRSKLRRNNAFEYEFAEGLQSHFYLTTMWRVHL